MAAKRRKSEGKPSKNVSNAKKSKNQTESDSDSDSSLDIEKWRKMALQLTGECVRVLETKQ